MPTPSFQISDEDLDQFDEAIFQQKVQGELDRDASRSDVIRMLIQDYIEGNENSERSTEPLVS